MTVVRQDIVTIGSNIAKYRKLKNYTQKELGELLDVNSKTISKWENGNVGPDITILKSLADVLDVTVEELLSGVKVKNKRYKFSYILNIILVLVSLILFLIVSYLNNKKYDLYEFKSDHDSFNVEGYVVSGKKESRFVVKEFSHLNIEKQDIKVKAVTIKVYCNNELVFVDKDTFEDLTIIEDAFVKFNLLSFSFDNEDCEEFYILAHYRDDKDRNFYYKIHLKYQDSLK